MVQSDKLKKIIAEVKEESSPVITLSNELKRIAEVDLDRFSKDKYTREPEDPMED